MPRAGKRIGQFTPLALRPAPSTKRPNVIRRENWGFIDLYGIRRRPSSPSVLTGVETPPMVWCIIHNMKTSLLALLAAVALASAATTTTTTNKKTTVGTATSKTSVPTSDKKKSQKEEGVAEAADPVSLVATSIDAATQIAMEAAKVAQAEAAKLAAIGSEAAAPAKAKLAEAVVVGGVAAAKELKKAKKEADQEKPEEKKPVTKPTSEKKPADKKPKEVSAL